MGVTTDTRRVWKNHVLLFLLILLHVYRRQNSGGPYKLSFIGTKSLKKYKNNIPVGSISCCSIIKKENKKPSALHLYLLLGSQSTLWPVRGSWRHVYGAKIWESLTPIRALRPGMRDPILKVSSPPILKVLMQKTPELWP